MRAAIALLVLVASVYAVQAFGLGEGNRFGKLGALSGKTAAPTPPQTGSALLINNTDAALLINNVDPACLVGGC